MTKAELIKALEPYADDQWVFVNLHSAMYPDGCQLIVQGVRPVPPWGRLWAGKKPDLIGLLVHDQNAEMAK